MKEVKVFGFKGNVCPFCVKATNLLNDNNIEFTFVDVMEERGKEELMEARGLGTLRGQTVPQIFINGEYIGGFKELKDILYNK